MEKLDILWQDEHLVAVNKPSGLLVHRSPIDRRETRFALQIVRDQLGRWVYPVHRLDRPTSGVLLMGLSPESARSLSEAFAAGRTEKTYLAVVRGVPQEAGEIDHPLLEELDKMMDPRTRTDKEAQQALTRFRTLATAELPFAVGRYPTSRYSLVEANPVTGRRHQLRRHLKHIFHPIVGDTKYGEGRHNRFFRDEFDCHRMLLAAVRLTFPHPVSGERITVNAPLDEVFSGVVESLGWQEAVG